MIVYDVILTNEGGDAECYYDIAAVDTLAAIAEAWRQYRDCPTVDNEQPPSWTSPKVGRALARRNGDSPWYIHQPDQPLQRVVGNSEHCFSWQVMS